MRAGGPMRAGGSGNPMTRLRSKRFFFKNAMENMHFFGQNMLILSLFDVFWDSFLQDIAFFRHKRRLRQARHTKKGDFSQN